MGNSTRGVGSRTARANVARTDSEGRLTRDAHQLASARKKPAVLGTGLRARQRSFPEFSRQGYGGREVVPMPVLELTDQQVIDLVNQLPSERLRRWCAPTGATLARVARTHARRRGADSRRRRQAPRPRLGRDGRGWSGLLVSVDDLVHEDRACASSGVRYEHTVGGDHFIAREAVPVPRVGTGGRDPVGDLQGNPRPVRGKAGCKTRLHAGTGSKRPQRGACLVPRGRDRGHTHGSRVRPR